MLLQELPLSYCLFTWIKYCWASAAVIYSIQLFSLPDTLFPHWPDCSSSLSLLCSSSFPVYFLLHTVSVQALLNIPLFHMLLLCNLSSSLWKPHDLFMLMDFPCIQPDPSFPTVSLYWMWLVVLWHAATCLSHGTATATCPAAMISHLYNTAAVGFPPCLQSEVNYLSFR